MIFLGLGAIAAGGLWLTPLPPVAGAAIGAAISLTLVADLVARR